MRDGLGSIELVSPFLEILLDRNRAKLHDVCGQCLCLWLLALLFGLLAHRAASSLIRRVLASSRKAFDVGVVYFLVKLLPWSLLEVWAGSA